MADAIRAVAILRDYLVHDDMAPLSLISSVISIENHIEQTVLINSNS